MYRLFHYDKSAQIKDIDFHRFYPGLQANLKWQLLEANQKPAIRQYLRPFVGENQLASWHTAIEGDLQSATEVEKEAIEMARIALAQYMIYESLPAQLANLSSLGLQVLNDREGTSSSPSQWQYKSLRWDCIRKGDTYLDQLLQFMDEHRVDFPIYDADPARRYRHSVVFSSVDQVDSFLNIQGSRRAYNRIIPYFKKAEDRNLRPMLGDTLFEEVRAWADGQPTDQQSELIRRCQNYVAEVGLAAALPHLSCVIEHDAIVVVSQMDGFDSRATSVASVSQAAISRLRQEAEVRGKQAAQDLLSFLAANAATFPSYSAPETEDSSDVIDAGGAIGIF